MTKQVTIDDVYRANPQWFAPGNQKFFGDKEYMVRFSGTGEAYMVRSTYAWTGMLSGPSNRRLHYRINTIKPDLKLGSLINEAFDTLEDVDDYLAEL